MERISEELFLDTYKPLVENTFPEDRFTYHLLSDDQAIQLTICDERRRWFEFKLRDRSHDGENWKPTPLCTWPNNHPDDAFSKVPAVEQSKYWQDPNYPLTLLYPEKTAKFIENPFDSLPFENPTLPILLEWQRTWDEVTQTTPCLYPGSFSLKKIPRFSNQIMENTLNLLQKTGYSYLTSVPTWFHVAQHNTSHFGFEYMYPDDQKKVEQIANLLPQNNSVERAQASWIVMLQFWNELMEQNNHQPEDYIDSRYILRDNDGQLITYPLRPERNLWLIKKV